MHELVRSQDWLGTSPYFYNVETSQHGDRIADVISPKNFEIDRAGLADYLRFGYCVFGQTPIRGVKFLRPMEDLFCD